MSNDNTWYDRQANISKLLTYTAILILVASLGWAAFEAYHTEYSPSMYLAIAGTATAAFLVGLSAIIDLLIIHAEALRNK